MADDPRVKPVAAALARARYHGIEPSFEIDLDHPHDLQRAREFLAMFDAAHAPLVTFTPAPIVFPPCPECGRADGEICDRPNCDNIPF